MEKGDFIRINYIGRLESGEIFDLTFEDVAKKENIHNPKANYRPVPIIIGAGFVIAGLEKAVFSMKVGEKKTVEVEPQEAFGEREPKLVRVVPKHAFTKQNLEPKQGMIIDFSGARGRVQSVSAGRVMVDFNNPLAGKKLKYDIEIVEKIEEPEEQIKAIFEFFGLSGVKVTITGQAVDVEAKLPAELKEKTSDLILKNVRVNNGKIEKVRFMDVYAQS
jgi:FKBP-type peptidyl-prolyl cis-trans isomerase 2